MLPRACLRFLLRVKRLTWVSDRIRGVLDLHEHAPYSECGTLRILGITTKGPRSRVRVKKTGHPSHLHTGGLPDGAGSLWMVDKSGR